MKKDWFEMHKAILVLIIGLLVGCGGMSGRGTKYGNSTEVIQREAISTVALIQEVEGGAEVYCGGTWISREVFITALHCIKASYDSQHEKELGEGEIGKLIGTKVRYTGLSEMRGKSNKVWDSWIGEVKWIDAGEDLALVKAPGSNMAHLAARIGEGQG